MNAVIEDNARIWLFASDRVLTAQEAEELKSNAMQFTQKWTAHKVALSSTADVLYNTFLLVGVDEDIHNASGCSIDSMHAFVREQGKKLGVNFFDRLRVLYPSGDSVENISLQEFEKRFSRGEVNMSTAVFNPLVRNGKELRDQFLVSVKDTWLAGRLQ